MGNNDIRSHQYWELKLSNMKNIIYNKIRAVLILSLGVITFSSCEREFSDDVEFETFSTNS